MMLIATSLVLVNIMKDVATSVLSLVGPSTKPSWLYTRQVKSNNLDIFSESKNGEAVSTLRESCSENYRVCLPSPRTLAGSALDSYSYNVGWPTKENKIN